MPADAMRALVYVGPNRIEARSVPLPQPGPGEALVRVAAVGVCGSDMHAFHGHDERRPPPLILGHEAAGVVVGGPLAGRRVAINPLVTDPACPAARAGRPHLSPTRQILSMPPRQGAFAEFVAAPERNLHPVPDALGLREAALTEPVAVAWHAVRLGRERLAATGEGDDVVVLGGGAIGMASALVARSLGAARVTVAEVHPGRRAMVAREPGLAAFDPSDPTAALPAADLVIDAAGAAATRALACRIVRPGGVIVHVGLLPGSDGLDMRRITLQEITVVGSYCYTPDDFAAALRAIEAGDLGALSWVEVRPFATGAQAFHDLDAGRVDAAKVVLAIG